MSKSNRSKSQNSGRTQVDERDAADAEARDKPRRPTFMSKLLDKPRAWIRQGLHW